MLLVKGKTSQKNIDAMMQRVSEKQGELGILRSDRMKLIQNEWMELMFKLVLIFMAAFLARWLLGRLMDGLTERAEKSGKATARTLVLYSSLRSISNVKLVWIKINGFDDNSFQHEFRYVSCGGFVLRESAGNNPCYENCCSSPFLTFLQQQEMTVLLNLLLLPRWLFVAGVCLK